MYQVILCEDKSQWNNFIRSSLNNNVFSETTFLDMLDIKYSTYLVLKKNKPIIGALIFDSRIIREDIPYTGNMYQGIAISSEMKGSISGQVNDYINGCEKLLSKIIPIHKRILLSLHPSLNDLRPFSWFNYHEPDKGTFSIEVAHTAFIDTLEYDNFHDYFALLSSTRKQEFKRAGNSNLIIRTNENIKDFINLFKMTFDKQNHALDNLYLETVQRVVQKSVDAGIAKLDIIYNKENIPLSATVFINDGKTSNYLHGASNPEYRNTGASTFLVMKNIEQCFNNKINFINLLGVNSPARGYFKTSFNAKVNTYFNVTFND
jgi:hypothetical protein